MICITATRAAFRRRPNVGRTVHWKACLTLVVAAAISMAIAPRPALAAVNAAVAVEQMLQATNRLRDEAGLPPLKADERLARAALDFARYMAQSDRYGHQADGREPSQRVEAAGYDWCMVAENIGWQYDSRGFDTATLARRLVDGWEKSPPHRGNMLDKRPREIGIGTAQSPRTGRHYAVQLFARPCAAQR
jgi:uncharacterized protein YkwD